MTEDNSSPNPQPTETPPPVLIIGIDSVLRTRRVNAFRPDKAVDPRSWYDPLAISALNFLHRKTGCLFVLDTVHHEHFTFEEWRFVLEAQGLAHRTLVAVMEPCGRHQATGLWDLSNIYDSLLPPLTPWCAFVEQGLRETGDRLPGAAPLCRLLSPEYGIVWSDIYWARETLKERQQSMEERLCQTRQG